MNDPVNLVDSQQKESVDSEDDLSVILSLLAGVPNLEWHSRPSAYQCELNQSVSRGRFQFLNPFEL